jgi:hypothetical protein
MRTLTVADVRPFASLCELQATMQATAAAKAGRSLFTLEIGDADPKSLTVKIDAVLKLERETANALRPYYEVFGLTPSARARLAMPPTAEAPVSKWAGLK